MPAYPPPTSDTEDVTPDATAEPPATSTEIPRSGPNGVPLVGPIVAVLRPPNTFCGVKAEDPDGDPLDYYWTLSPGSCGLFSWERGTPERPTAQLATWYHPHPGPGAIRCGDAPSHPGTVTVEVTDGQGGKVVRTYSGSLGGVGPVNGGAPQPPEPAKVPGLSP